MSNNTNFVILTYGRTGSSYLCDLLNSHSQIKCFYEIYKDFDKPLSQSDDEFINSTLSNTSEPVKGFKILEYQATYDVHKALVKDIKYKKILLIRRNPIDRFISYKLAEDTGIWHLDHQLSPDIVERGILDIFRLKYTSKEILQKIKETIKGVYERFTYKVTQISIDKDELLQNVAHVEAYNKMIQDANEDKDSFKIIYYEDLRDNLASCLTDIQQFLELIPEELISSRDRINHHPKNERLSNFASIKESLKGTSLEKFI